MAQTTVPEIKSHHHELPDLATFLNQLQLESLHEVFIKEQITMRDLIDCTTEELKVMKVGLGPRKRILKAAQTFKGETRGPAEDFYAALDIVLEEFRAMLDKDDCIFGNLLEASLHAAKEEGKKLDERLRNAITDEYGCEKWAWPTCEEDYLMYLRLFACLVPDEADHATDDNAWQSSPTANGYNQKVYDLLCHFYFLISHSPEECKLQSYPKFAGMLTKYNKVVGCFLNTPASLTRATLKSFKANPMYNIPHLYSEAVAEIEKDVRKASFNTFFSRQIDGSDAQTGMTAIRPINEPSNPLAVVAPADCTFKEKFMIRNGIVGDWKTGEPQSCDLKHFYQIGNVGDLLGEAAAEFEKDFLNGSFVHYFLSPFDYHRFHTPVAGTVVAVERVSANTFLDVQLDGGQFDVPNNAADGGGYQFTQSRGIVIIEATGGLGKVAIIPVGMAQVSGVVMYDGLDDPSTPGQNVPNLLNKEVKKGEEFGKFLFGGSDIIVLFQKLPKDLYLFECSPNQVPIHFQYGQTMAYATPTPSPAACTHH